MLVNDACIQSRVWFLILKLFGLLRSLWCGTLSKALLKSSNITSIWSCPWFMICVQSCYTSVSQRIPLRKPCCLFVNAWFCESRQLVRESINHAMLIRLGEQIQISVHRLYLMCTFFQKTDWWFVWSAALVWLMLLRSVAIPSSSNAILGIYGWTEWRLGRNCVISFMKTDVNWLTSVFALLRTT